MDTIRSTPPMGAIESDSPHARGQAGPPAVSTGGPLRIAVYYPWLYLTSGAERTVLEFARRSRHHVAIFTNDFQPDSTFPGLRDMDIRVLEQVPVERSIRSVLIAATRILRQKLDLSEFHALLVVCEGLGDLVTLRHRTTPTFCLCLTPLRVVFDPYYRQTYLATRTSFQRGVIRLGSIAFRALDRLAWRRYRRVVVISEEVRRRAVAGGLADPAKLRVLHPGVDSPVYTPTGTNSAAASRTFFVPGRIMWTKNLELAIEAFKLFRSAVKDSAGWRLEIAGIVDRKSQPYLERLQALAGRDASISFRTRLTDEEMLEGYHTCFAMLFTAFNEDWGLVVIEAMAAGAPVVATDRGGPREIVRHEHDGLLADPDPQSFARAMLRLASEQGLRERIATNGPAGAARFGWEPFVRELDDMIDADLRLGGEPAPTGRR